MWKKIKEQFSLFAEKWVIFFTIILDPLTLILLVALFFLIYLSQQGEQNKLLMNILIAIISVTSGISGARIWNRWSEVTETKIIRTRGKLAIRNLGLLLLNIRFLEKRVKFHLEKLANKDGENELIKNYLEETIGKCNSLEEEVINSIENWKDIIPEADLRTQIGVISELKDTQSKLTDEINGLKDKLSKTTEESSREKEELKKKISDKEKELVSVKTRLQEKEIQAYPFFSSTGLSGYSGGGGTANPVFFPTCKKCGKTLTTESLEDFAGGICPVCKSDVEKKS